MAAVVKFLEVEGAPKSYRTGDHQWQPGQEQTVSDPRTLLVLASLPFMQVRHIRTMPPPPPAGAPEPVKHADPDLNAALGGPLPGEEEDEAGGGSPTEETPALEAAGGPGDGAAPTPAPAPAQPAAGKAAGKPSGKGKGK